MGELRKRELLSRAVTVRGSGPLTLSPSERGVRLAARLPSMGPRDLSVGKTL